MQGRWRTARWRPLLMGASSGVMGLATAPPGGCIALRLAMARMERPTATPALISAGKPFCNTAAATSAKTALPITAGHGWASGQLGTANSRNALTPSGAIKTKLTKSVRQPLISISKPPVMANARVALIPARIASSERGRSVAEPKRADHLAQRCALPDRSAKGHAQSLASPDLISVGSAFLSSQANSPFLTATQIRRRIGTPIMTSNSWQADRFFPPAADNRLVSNSCMVLRDFRL